MAVRAFMRAEWIKKRRSSDAARDRGAPARDHAHDYADSSPAMADGSVNSPNEMVKKAKLKELLTEP